MYIVYRDGSKGTTSQRNEGTLEPQVPIELDLRQFIRRLSNSNAQNYGFIIRIYMHARHHTGEY